MMRRNAWRGQISAALLLCCSMALFAGPVRAESDYELTVAFDAQFDHDGRLVQLQPHDESEQPEAR